MSAALDKALREMSIEEDRSIKLKTMPKISAIERNMCSLMGRLLKPEIQKMSELIHDMPRMWHMYQRCRGYALSKDRFQFTFDSETDLKTVMDVRAWMFDDWSIVVEWVENIPENYLRCIPIWVRLHNIPIECYDIDAH
ncbi:hypothetical protein V5N11_013243 [Cardamine amara subsp. amara]|uniref:DUF4283 domain-containing protein n=1 Tax=Cardamine amara subsp. amara TaxID=228776 RepID=A0ABD1ATZ5_CARAN